MCSNRKVKVHMKIFSSVSKFCVYGSNTSKNFFIAKRKNHFDVMNVIPLLQKKYLNTTYFQCLHILQYMQMIRVFVCFLFSIIIDNFLLIYLFFFFSVSFFPYMSICKMNKISITIYGPNTHYFSVLKVKPLKA